MRDDGPLKFFKLAWKEFLFYSLGQTGIVDVRDVGRFMIQLMESDISGERYILNGSPISFKNLMFRISELLDKKNNGIGEGALIHSVFVY